MGLIEQIEAEGMKESVPRFNVGTPSKSAIALSKAVRKEFRISRAS